MSTTNDEHDGADEGAPDEEPGPAASSAHHDDGAHGAHTGHGAHGSTAPGMFGILFKRAFSTDLDPGRLLPDEESAVAVNFHGRSEPLKRVLLWRRGALLVGLVFLLPATLIHLIRDFISIGKGGLTGTIGGLTLFGTFAGIGLCFGVWLAFRRWDHWMRSRRVLFWTWLIAFLTPFVMALVPYDMFAGGLMEARIEARVRGGLSVVIALSPKVLSLIPGLLRAGLASKALFPGAAAPGWLILLGAPFYMLLLFVVILLPYQFAGGGLMALALLCFLAAPIFLIRAGRALTSPMELEPATATIRSTRLATLLLNSGGALFLIIGLADMISTLGMNPLDAIAPLVAVVANVFVLGVIGVDTMIVALTRSHQPHDTPDEARARQAHLRSMNAFIAAQSEAQPDVTSREDAQIDYDQPTQRGGKPPPTAPPKA